MPKKSKLQIESTIIHVRLMICCIIFKQCKAFKKDVEKELIGINSAINKMVRLVYDR